ncbi:hypothetical protein HYV86_07580 [Candidatus Woesearchaeota archaeon]|nr:hypothetical protein [Candidatus Woesearchaeota archaeon]
MYDKYPKKDSNIKFYIVMGIIVLGAVALLFVFKDGTITGGAISDTRSEESSPSKSGSTLFGDSQEAEEFSSVSTDDNPLEKVFKQEVSRGTRDVPVTLSFNKVPALSKKVSVKQMELVFDDLTTSIQVNNDRLELNNLQGVTLDIGDFEGDFVLSGSSLSLAGKARRIGVNGVALESGRDMEIVISDLTFKKLDVGHVALKDVVMPAGDGTLSVGGKLTYNLVNEKAAVYYFTGSMVVGSGDAVFKLEGTTRGASVDGDVVTISVK